MRTNEGMKEKLLAIHKTLENAIVLGDATRTAGLHRGRAAAIIDDLAEMIVDLDVDGVCEQCDGASVVECPACGV